MRVHLNYGRGQRAVDLPDTLDVTVIAKQAMPLLAISAAGDGPGARSARGLPGTRGRGGERRERLHPDLRLHAPGAQRRDPAAADPHPARCRDGAGADHGAGGDRAASAQRGRGACRPGRRSLGAGDGGGREPLRARGRRSRAAGHDGARHGGAARPALRRGRSAHRDRAGGAALHGRLVGRAEGDRARRRPRRDHHHLPQRALHGASQLHQLRAGGQSAARGAAGDHGR